MKEKLNKLSASLAEMRKRLIHRMERPVAVMKIIFGWAIMLTLFVGGATFLAYVAAIILGGDEAVRITAFIKNYIIPGITYASTVSVLYGLIIMYLSGQTALSAKKAKTEAKSNEDKNKA